MNIFYLDKDPELAAQYHNDSHVRKMILEYAQLLSTAHRVLDGEEYVDISAKGRKVKRWAINDHSGRDEVMYKATHINHPSAKWIRESPDHYAWTYRLFDAAGREFNLRWGKDHKTWLLLKGWLQSVPTGLVFNKSDWVDPPLAMEDKYKLSNAIDSYRNYYINGKSHLAKWTNRSIPFWYDNAPL